jgi:hypothetical protein
MLAAHRALYKAATLSNLQKVCTRSYLPLLCLLFHTCSKVNAGMLAAHRALYKAATEGDIAAFNASVAEVQRLFLITYIQATLKYAELMDRATAKGDQDTLLADQVQF